MTKALRSVIICLLVALVSRGTDYVSGSADGDREAELPPLTWGVACLVAATVVIVGMVWHYSRLVIAGCLLSAAIYVMFAVYQVPLIFDSDPPDDWRVCGDYIALAGLWSVVCATLALRYHVAQARRGGTVVTWEVLSRWAESPASQFLVGVLFLVFGTPAILSEKAAEKFGAFGVLARAWRDRKKRAEQEAESIHQRELADLRHEIERVDQARLDDASEFRAELDRVSASEREQHAYIVWITEVFRGLEVWAVDHGLQLPPPFMTFTEWKKKDRSED